MSPAIATTFDPGEFARPSVKRQSKREIARPAVAGVPAPKVVSRDTVPNPKMLRMTAHAAKVTHHG